MYSLLNFSTEDLVILFFGALVGYGITFLTFHLLDPAKAHVYSASIIALALTAYWVWLDHSLHAENRYYLRTVLIVITPGLGVMAVVCALDADGILNPRIPLLSHLMAVLKSGISVRAATGALVLVLLIHAVETAKFVTAWTNYEAALRTLALGTASDPALEVRSLYHRIALVPI